MLNYIDVEQNTPEWFALRSGKLTSSKIGTIMANFGKAFGEPAKKYAVDIAIEQITGNPIESTYSNDHMARGHEQEPIARALYETEQFCDVDNGAFFTDDDFIGCSPDGLVGDVGLIEIKSVIPSVHYANIKRGGIDPAYRWQVVANLMFTSRQWIDFVSFCSAFPDDKQLYVCRVYKDDCDEEFAQLNERIAEFKALVDTTKNTILNSQYSTVRKAA